MLWENLWAIFCSYILSNSVLVDEAICPEAITLLRRLKTCNDIGPARLVLGEASKASDQSVSSVRRTSPLDVCNNSHLTPYRPETFPFTPGALLP